MGLDIYVYKMKKDFDFEKNREMKDVLEKENEKINCQFKTQYPEINEKLDLLYTSLACQCLEDVLEKKEIKIFEEFFQDQFDKEKFNEKELVEALEEIDYYRKVHEIVSAFNLVNCEHKVITKKEYQEKKHLLPAECRIGDFFESEECETHRLVLWAWW